MRNDKKAMRTPSYGKSLLNKKIDYRSTFLKTMDLQFSPGFSWKLQMNFQWFLQRSFYNQLVFQIRESLTKA